MYGGLKTPMSNEPLSSPDLMRSPGPYVQGGAQGSIETPIGPITSPAYNPLSPAGYHGGGAAGLTPQQAADQDQHNSPQGNGAGVYRPASPVYDAAQP